MLHGQLEAVLGHMEEHLTTFEVNQVSDRE